MDQKIPQKKTPEEKKSRAKIRKLVILVAGILASALCALLCIVGLDFVRVKSGYGNTPDGLLSTDTLNALVENNLVLYKDLANSQTPEHYDYEELYIRPNTNCDWVLNENDRRIYLMYPEQWEQILMRGQVPADAARVYTYINEMLAYFAVCEENLAQINETFGYCCEDLVTGSQVSNLNTSFTSQSAQYYLLSFLYDEYGNCSVERAECGDNSEKLNRYASQAIREFDFSQKTSYQSYDEAATLPLSEYFSLTGPVNCRITYSISEAAWNSRQFRASLSTILKNKDSFLILFGLFFLICFFILHARSIRELGVREFIVQKSVLYRFFRSVTEHLRKTYDAFTHFDVTRKANKIILKIVLINGGILLVVSILWTGRIVIALVYSIFLYVILRKYISDLQKKFGILLGAINEIAQGHLNVEIQEDLGVFEPFKPQIYRIQTGFKNAVEEEVKSQRMKTELITNVSHDLKTPLTAIITYINLLKDETITEEQRRDYLDTLERKSLRLKDLIEDLFEVSRAASKNMKLNLTDVDLMNLIRQVAFEMEDKLKENHLDLRMNLPEGKVFLQLDPQRTYRIYENLFVNISKYSMPGTRVYINAAISEKQVIVTLKNITAQEISVAATELTERFVRGDSSRNTEGSGLGLAIAKSFATLQNGDVKVEVDGDLFKVTTIWTRT